MTKKFEDVVGGQKLTACDLKEEFEDLLAKQIPMDTIKDNYINRWTNRRYK